MRKSGEEIKGSRAVERDRIRVKRKRLKTALNFSRNLFSRL